MRKSLERAAALVLTAAMMMGLCLTASAAQPVTVTLDGQVITTEAYVDSNDRTQAPAAIAEALGMTVTADGAAATYAKDGVSVTFQGTQAGDTAMDTQAVEGYVPVAYLAPAFGYGIRWDGAARTVALTSPLALTVDDIESIQAYTDMTFYGQGVVKVEVTYAEGTDLSSVTADSYILEDRGSLTPDFGEVAIADASVNGRVVTLTIEDDTDATPSNVLLYTGDAKEGSRERNAFGIYCTGAWYRDTAGVIHYGKEASGEYVANETGMGYQARPCLELKLRHTGEDASAALALADGKGQYTDANKWLPTVDANFGEGGFITFEEAGIQIESTAKDATDGTADQYVRGYIYVPEDYTGDEAVPVVFTITGNGTSFWILEDGTNNFGCNIMYDAATTAWMGKGAIVVGIHDRSMLGKGGDNYDYLVDDVNVMKYILDNYNIDEDRIIIHGNSRSTMAASTIIQALAGQPYSAGQDAANWGTAERTKSLDKSVYDFDIGVFACNNGLYGGQQLWTYEDRVAIAKTGLKAWIFDAEQDFNNIDFVDEQIRAFHEAGYDDAWIAENLRLTCFPSELFYYWGESDHSTTRINYWYFGDGQVYYGPNCHIEKGQLVYDKQLQPGDTYTVQARGASRDGDKTGHEYTVYGENFIDWALGK